MDRFDHTAFLGTKLGRAGRWAVCFAADWCPFCQKFLDRYTHLQTPDGAQTAIGDVTDLDSPLWDSFQLDVVPTLVVFEEGSPVWRRDGRLGEGLDTEDIDALQRALASLPPPSKTHRSR